MWGAPSSRGWRHSGHDVVAIGKPDVGLSFASPAFRARLRDGTSRATRLRADATTSAMRTSQRVC